jgi:predicted RNase H-like HicB family nuclease
MAGAQSLRLRKAAKIAIFRVRKRFGATERSPGQGLYLLRPAMLSIEIDREEDGRWIGEVPQLPGVLVYAPTPDQARAKAIALAFRVIADRIEHGEDTPINVRDYFVAA